jgi:hypothetical protein
MLRYINELFKHVLEISHKIEHLKRSATSLFFLSAWGTHLSYDILFLVSLLSQADRKHFLLFYEV